MKDLTPALLVTQEVSFLYWQFILLYMNPLQSYWCVHTLFPHGEMKGKTNIRCFSKVLVLAKILNLSRYFLNWCFYNDGWEHFLTLRCSVGFSWVEIWWLWNPQHVIILILSEPKFSCHVDEGGEDATHYRIEVFYHKSKAIRLIVTLPSKWKTELKQGQQNVSYITADPLDLLTVESSVQPLPSSCPVIKNIVKGDFYDRDNETSFT